MDKNTAITNFLDSVDNPTLVALWNIRCEECNDVDSQLFDMGEFDEVMSGQSPYEITQRVHFGNFNPNHRYFSFDGYGNLVSCEYVVESQSPYIESELAESIESNPNAYADYIEDNDLFDDFTEFVNERLNTEYCQEALYTILDEANAFWSVVTDEWDALLEDITEYLNSKNEEE